MKNFVHDIVFGYIFNFRDFFSEKRPQNRKVVSNIKYWCNPVMGKTQRLLCGISLFRSVQTERNLKQNIRGDIT